MKGEEEFDSICFNKRCIQEDQQLYSSCKYAEGVHHYFHLDHCKYLRADMFKTLYDLPHRLVNKMIKKFNKLLTQEINRRSKDFQNLFKKLFQRQAKKYFKQYMNQFTFKECPNLLNKLIYHSHVSKRRQTQFLTQIYQKDQAQIQMTVQQKLSQLTNQFPYICQRILKTLNLKIREIFFQRCSQIVVKKEQDASSASYVEHKMQSPPESQSERLQLLKCQESQEEKSSDSQQQKSAGFEAMKELKQCSSHKNESKFKTRRYSHLDSSNIIDSQRFRKNDKVNYVNYHQYGNNSKENFFEKAYIINSSVDVTFLKHTKQAIQYHLLIINHKIKLTTLIDVITTIKPIKIIINAEIINFQEKILNYIPIPILNELISFQQRWDCDQFPNSYANCVFNPQGNTDFPLKKAQITTQIWDSLIRLENIWISSQYDIRQIKKSHKSFECLNSLKIQPLNTHSDIKIHDVKSLFANLQTLNTLNLQNLMFDQDYTDFFLNLCQRNPIKCLVLKNVGNFNQDCINQISKLELNRLIIEAEIDTDADFTPILRMPSLKFLSLRRIKLDTFNYFNRIQLGKSPLKNLQHLNLSNSMLSSDDLMKCLYSVNSKNIKYLNLENNKLDETIGVTLKDFANMSELNLNNTTLNLEMFLKSFDKPLKLLERLNLLGYFDINDNNLENAVCLLTDGNLKQLFEVFPCLKYVNLSSHQSIPKAKYFCPFKISLAVKGVEQRLKK